MKKKIILIVGASGVGKDTLIREAKKELKKEFNFVRRYITRKPDKSEKNFFLENSAFKLLRDNKYFISSWEAHGNFYAISKNSIKKGANVISISRSKINDFERIFSNVYVINITLNKEELRNRLMKRGRESFEEIKKRLDRNYDRIEAKNLINFENDKLFEESSKSFIKILKEIDEL
jgi:ribose 1,5-bisphosphokinase